MDRDLLSALELLRAVARMWEELLALASEVRSAAGVVDLKHGLDCRNYASGVTLEAYVDAELMTGNAVVWWLEMNPRQEGGPWTVEASVRFITSEGQDAIWQQEVEVSRLDALTSALVDAGRALRDRSDLLEKCLQDANAMSENLQ